MPSCLPGAPWALQRTTFLFPASPPQKMLSEAQGACELMRLFIWPHPWSGADAEGSRSLLRDTGVPAVMSPCRVGAGRVGPSLGHLGRFGGEYWSLLPSAQGWFPQNGGQHGPLRSSGLVRLRQEPRWDPRAGKDPDSPRTPPANHRAWAQPPARLPRGPVQTLPHKHPVLGGGGRVLGGPPAWSTSSCPLGSPWTRLGQVEPQLPPAGTSLTFRAWGLLDGVPPPQQTTRPA